MYNPRDQQARRRILRYIGRYNTRAVPIRWPKIRDRGKDTARQDVSLDLRKPELDLF